MRKRQFLVLAAGTAATSAAAPYMRRSGSLLRAAPATQPLADPERFLPGTTMTFARIKDAKARRDVIAYLKAVAEDKAPPAPAGGGGMME
jgi:cytochrome c2